MKPRPWPAWSRWQPRQRKFSAAIAPAMLPDAVVPFALLGAWALGLCWSSRWNFRVLQRVFQLATVIVLTISMAAISRIADLPGLFDETDIGRGLTRAGEHAREVSGLLLSRHRDNLSPRAAYRVL